MKPKDLQVIGFTGHRPNKLGGYEPNNPLARMVRIAMLKETKAIAGGYTGPSIILSGGALGVDQWACYVAMKLGLPFIIVSPGVWQSHRWPQDARSAYAKLLDNSGKGCVHLVKALAEELGKKHQVRVVENVCVNRVEDHSAYILMNPDSGYRASLLQERNKALVELSDVMIAVWDGSTGGTHNCVKLIQDAKKPMVRIDPIQVKETLG